MGVVLALVSSASAVEADESTKAGTSISFPLTTVVVGEPGTIHEITSSDAPTDLVGQDCSVTATVDNNESVHPQSDLIVASGSDQVIVSDVEATPGGSTTAEGALTLGSTITVSVRLGPDGVFSAAGSVDLVCVEAAPGTTPTTPPLTAVAGISAQPPAAPQALVVAPSSTG